MCVDAIKIDYFTPLKNTGCILKSLNAAECQIRNVKNTAALTQLLVCCGLICGAGVSLPSSGLRS